MDTQAVMLFSGLVGRWRHGARLDISALSQQHLVIFIQSLLLASQSTYADSPGLKVRG